MSPPFHKEERPRIPCSVKGNTGAFSPINEAVSPSGLPPAEALTVRSDGQDDGLTDQGQEKPIRLASARRHNPFKRIIPRMVGNGELPHVAREQRAGTQIFRGLRRVFRHHMDVPPVLVVLPAVEHSEIKPAEACADFREMLAVSAVSAEKNPAFRGNKGKARPKGLVPGQ